MSYSSRFWLYAPLCLFLALAAWAGIHWWQVASALNRKLDAMKGHETVPGIVIDWRTKTLSGFPFNIDLVFAGLSVKGAGAHGPFAWESENFALHALTYGRDKQVMEAAGRQHLAWTGPDGGRHNISFLPAELHASSVFGAKGLSRFDLDILDAGGTDSENRKFTTGRMQLHLRRDPKADIMDLVASADRLAIADGIGPDLRISGNLKPASAFGALLRGEGSWPRAHAHWQTHGGSALTNIEPQQGVEHASALQDLFAALY